MKLPYWIQRADYSATDFDPVSLPAAQALLRAHDWKAERSYQNSLEDAGEDSCPPGIGFVGDNDRVLHICPEEDGSAYCFYLTTGTDRADVSRAGQRRLVKLFYQDRDAELIRTLEHGTAAHWSGILRELRGMAFVVALIMGAGLLLVAGAVAILNTMDGVPLSETGSRLLEILPTLLMFKLGVGVFLVLFFGGIGLAIYWLENSGRRISVEGHEHTGTLVMAVAFTALFVVLAFYSDKWTELPLQLGNIAGVFGAFVWPHYVMGRHRRQQDRILDKIRAQYVMAITSLMASQERIARRRLQIIRSLETHWRLGAGYPYRIALLTYVLATNMALAFAGQVFAYHLGAYPKRDSFMESVQLLWSTPWVLGLAAGIAFLFSFPAFRDASQIKSRPWSEFYGDRLVSALKAGKGVEPAPQHEGPDLAEGVSARELLGLNPHFTKADLRSAWLRLARELHPDRWMSSGPAVRRMKEASLKRVNAARDELMAQAS